MQPLLNSNNNNSEWNSDLIRDLSFIKKNLRYPLSKKTVLPVLRTVITLAFLAWLGYSFFFKKEHHGSFYFPAFIFLMMVMISLTGTIKMLQTLKFISVPTDLFAEGNMQLIKNFLESERL